jgi:2-polyprenyl-6-methoxyphenol hydroxylase-like FAD-dependent oxidoreductase
MKIIIVGGGIAGLSTYLHLLKHLPKINLTIYESHSPHSLSSRDLNLDTLSASTTLVGGGLGISPNGMRVLRELSKELHDAVAAQGFPAEHFLFKGANGWTLGKQHTGDRQFRKGEDEEVCIASSRHGLWETLTKAVGEGVVKYRKVVGIERDTSSGQIKVRLMESEGNEEEDVADLLIGADGVKSIVRSDLLGNDKFKPTYTYVSVPSSTATVD